MFLNEAALLQLVEIKIDAADIDEAEDRVIAGPSKKRSRTISKEREDGCLSRLVIQSLSGAYQMLVWFIKSDCSHVVGRWL